MKKTAAFLLTLMICTALAACGGEADNSPSVSPSVTASAVDGSESPTDAPSESEGNSTDAPSESEGNSSDDIEPDEEVYHWLADVESGRYYLSMVHYDGDDQDTFSVLYKEYGDESIHEISGTWAKKDDGNYTLLSEYGEIFHFSIRDGSAVFTIDGSYGEISFSRSEAVPFHDFEEIFAWLNGETDIP